jgi:hypothetical protein
MTSGSSSRRRIVSITAAAAIGLILMIPLVLGALPTSQALVIEHAEHDEQLESYAVEDGDQFEIQYVHSFEKTPIHQRYEVNGTAIVQVEERYKYFASGTDHTHETYQDGNWTVAPLEEEHESFTVRVAGSTEQNIVIDGTEKPLDSYAEPGEPITISVVEKNRFESALARAK